MSRVPDLETVPVCTTPEVPSAWDPLILLTDKPSGWSSFDVIRRVRRVSPIRKVGHAGTLDPMATGLLVCLSGKATRLMNRFLAFDKEYTGTIRLGQTTASWDAETEVEIERDASGISDAAIQDALPRFTGDIQQQTPVYSAVKVGGERLYKKARRGERPVVVPRQVTVYAFEMTGRRGNDVDIRVRCSSGTYIRSLAHELGEALGPGGHLVALRRTSIGPYRVENAWQVEPFMDAVMASREGQQEGG